MTMVGLLLAAALDLTVKTGMAPGENPLVTCPIDPLRAPVRVVDAKGRETPSAVRLDPSGVPYVAFRAVGADILQLLDYRVTEGRGRLSELAGVPTLLPGMNLIRNADFSMRDGTGDICEWNPSGQYGVKAPWSEKTRTRIRAKGGVLGLENASALTYVTGLEAGHVYRLSYDARSAARLMTVILWFRGTKGTVANDWMRGVSNYKISNDFWGTNTWQHIENSTFVHFNEKTKKLVYNSRELLPGTGSGYLEIGVSGGRGAIRNLRFEDVSFDSGVRVTKKRSDFY